jgi:hypothetical protein
MERLPSFRPPSSKAKADRGKEIHAQAEAYLLGELKLYPPDLQRVSSHAMLLKQKKALSEQKLAVKIDWSKCEWDDPEAYMRAIIDVLYTDEQVCHIQDWKTGQVYDSHDVQLLDYVPVVAAHYPDMTYQTRLIYIDQGFVSQPKTHGPERIRPIRLMLDGRIKLAEEDTIFPVKPGRHCSRCDYSARFGGPCRF